MADEERGGVRRWAVRIGSVLAMLPVLYVLSLGPAVRWASRRVETTGSMSGEQIASLELFYRPLQSIHDNSPPIGTALDWYVDLWR
jgi:hypothetical protein